jgi:hypothetical protein
MLPAGDIEEKCLYFIETAADAGEGEFKVGVARVQGSADANGLVPVAWYTRKHGTDAAQGGNSGPTFVPYMVQVGQRGRRVGTSLEMPEHFLPVVVELTGKSVAPMGPTIAGSNLRLTKKCVDRLRIFFHRRRPDLIAEPAAPTAIENGSASAPAPASAAPPRGRQATRRAKANDHDSSEEELELRGAERGRGGEWRGAGGTGGRGRERRTTTVIAMAMAMMAMATTAMHSGQLHLHLRPTSGSWQGTKAAWQRGKIGQVPQSMVMRVTLHLMWHALLGTDPAVLAIVAGGSERTDARAAAWPGRRCASARHDAARIWLM